MTLDLPDALARRADSVDPPAFDAHAVLAHGERLVRRRNRLTAAGAALVLALGLGTTAVLLDGTRTRTEPADPPDTGQSQTRQITYGEGQTLHLGDLEIDTGLDFLSVDLTDEGAGLTTLDGGIWYTDGQTVERIGTTTGGRAVSDGVTWPVNRPREWIANDTAGSLLAWVEYPDGRAGPSDLVVFDSERRAVVARQPIDVAPGSTASALFIADRQVFVAGISVGQAGSTSGLLRYDVDRRVFDGVTDEEVEAERRSAPRALLVGPSAEEGELLNWDGWDVGTQRAESVMVQDSKLDGLFDPRTGEQIEIEVADGYEGEKLWFAQWVDDDRFALISSGGTYAGPVGDLLLCRVSDGRCGVAVEKSTWTIEPLLPGHGGVGGERALIEAAAAQRDQRGD